MAKNIVFCADGTWNSPNQVDDANQSAFTNVFKLFLNLSGADTQETLRRANEQERVLGNADDPAQVAKYLHGVGDADNFLARLLGGTLGAGLIARVVRGYTFISRNYRPGDHIFLTGFSRGAYTARALAGLIATKGLLDATQVNLQDHEKAYRLGAAVWYDYRRAALATKKADFWGSLQEVAADLPGFLTANADPAIRIAVPRIAAVAVWDTVGALGIPAYNLKNERVDSFQFADLVLSPIVASGLHAVAVDEQRADFTPTLWKPDTRRVKQALFPGAHADVGGGYSMENNESGLSDAALVWMIRELTALGVKFVAPMPASPNPNPAGMAHQPWLSPAFLALPKSARKFGKGLLLSQSVLDRMAAGPVAVEQSTAPRPYRPENLKDYLAADRAAPGVNVVS